MTPRRVRIAVLLLLGMAAAFLPVMALGGTEVYIKAMVQVTPSQEEDRATIAQDAIFLAQYRVARADISGVDIKQTGVGTINFKARNIADPDAFMRYMTRQGKWSVVGEDGKALFPFKNVKKTLMDTSGEKPAIAVLLSKAAGGAATGTKDGDVLTGTLIWDEEKVPLSMKVADGGKALLLSNPDWTLEQAWYIRATLTLAPYPCTLKVIDFRHGDDILKSIFG